MPDTALSNAAVPDPADNRVETFRIIAIIGMVLGLSGLLCLPYRAFFEVSGPRETEGGPPLGYWPAVFSIAGLGLSLLLTAGSMAAFRLKPVARPLLLLYAFGSLLAGLVSMSFYLRELITDDRRSLIFRWGGMGAVYELLMWPAAIAFSAYLLYAMTRPSARAVFRKGAQREAMDRSDR